MEGCFYRAVGPLRACERGGRKRKRIVNVRDISRFDQDPCFFTHHSALRTESEGRSTRFGDDLKINLCNFILNRGLPSIRGIRKAGRVQTSKRPKRFAAFFSHASEIYLL